MGEWLAAAAQRSTQSQSDVRAQIASNGVPSRTDALDARLTKRRCTGADCDLHARGTAVSVRPRRPPAAVAAAVAAVPAMLDRSLSPSLHSFLLLPLRRVEQRSAVQSVVCMWVWTAAAETAAGGRWQRWRGVTAGAHERTPDRDSWESKDSRNTQPQRTTQQ